MFSGVAAEGLNEDQKALNAYNCATEQQPDQLLAWQGLCSLLKKKDDEESNKRHITACEKLITLLKG